MRQSIFFQKFQFQHDQKNPKEGGGGGGGTVSKKRLFVPLKPKKLPIKRNTTNMIVGYKDRVELLYIGDKHGY
jgi:hypothetical protein